MAKSIQTLILLFLMASSVLAEPVKCTLVHQRGPNGLSISESKALFVETQKFYANAGIDLRLKNFISTKKGPRQKGLSNAEMLRLLVLWKKFFDARTNTYGTLKLVVLPPYRDSSNRLWMSGFAYGRCTRKLNSIAVTNAVTLNQSGLSRWLHSIAAQAHEAGHLLGASHDESNENLMSSGVLYYIKNYVLSFNPKALEEMKQCQNWN